MKEAVKKYWILALAFVMTAGVCLLFCTRKQGLFIDEVYTYGLSNSYEAPYLTDLKDGDLTDKIITREEAEAYLTVGPEDAFRFDSVYHNLERDVHPPLYYWIFHFVSSVFQHSSSKWIGLGINAVLFLLTCAVLSALCLQLYSSLEVSAAVTALYGMSVLGLSTVMMIRMYMLLAFFTVGLAFTVARIMRRGGSAGLYAQLCLVIFGGMMTQYYFVFYAFFLCAAYDLYVLCKKDFRVFLLFSLSALAGVALAVAVFPACLQQVFGGNGQAVGGSSVLEALKDTSTYFDRLSYFGKEVSLMLRGMKWAACGAVVCLLFTCRRLPAAVREKRIPFEALVILLPLPAAYVLTVLIAPLQAQELRYVYNLTPIAAAGTGFLLCAAERCMGNFRGSSPVRKAAALLIFLAALLCAKARPPATLFTQQAGYEAIAETYAGLPCVYLADGPRAYGPLTQDLPELKHFNSFLVVSSTASPALKDYLGDADSAVLYISTNDYWTDGYGYDPEEAVASFGADTGLADSELLYIYEFEGQAGLSSAYLMKGLKP